MNQNFKDYVCENQEELFADNVFRKLVCSNNNKHQYKKIEVVIKQQSELFYQVISYKNNQVFHKNCSSISELILILEEFEYYTFKQFDFIDIKGTSKFLVNKKGNFKILTNNNKATEEIANHNKQKNTFFKDKVPVDFLIALKIMDASGRVYNDKQAKFRQINKYIEFVESIEANLPQTPVIIDFGCGKGYMTFALHSYLVSKGFKPRIIGIDLKTQVINDCQLLATKLGYEGLNFIVQDIFTYEPDYQIDMVASLHACDIATDFCLYTAIKNNARVVLSVPCCQKQINQQLKKQNDLILKHGFLKNEFASILTDAIRGLVLENHGYDVTICEFISASQTPKNTLIRAVKSASFKKGTKQDEIKQVLDKYQVTQKLVELTNA